MGDSAKASLDRLKFSNFKLKTLLNITRSINANLPVTELLNSFEKLLTEELNIGKVLLYIYQKPHWNLIMKSGVEPGDYESIVPERDLVPIEDITFSMSNLVFGGFDFIIPVVQDNQPLAYVIIGDFEDEQEGIAPSIRHLHFIQTLTNIIIVAIENRRLMEVNMQQERFKKEMEMAAKMQNMLVPKEDIFKNDDRITVKPFYMPHYEVGGDYYDFDYLSDEEMFFCIADVSGKGMSAAILMSNFQASLKALFVADMDMSTLVKRLNSIVVRNSNGDRFITLFIGRYNFNTRLLKYINAGHNPPILFDCFTKEIQFLKASCPGLGMLDEIPSLKEGVLTLDHECKLLCFTDGVVELEKDGMDDYGQKIVEREMKKNSPIGDTINSIISALDIQRANENLFDDITLLGIDFFIK